MSAKKTYTIFTPTPNGTQHTTEEIVVHQIDGDIGEGWGRRAIELAGRWPQIPPEVWARHGTRDNHEPLLVAERPGWTPAVYPKSEIDDLHNDGLLPTNTDEVFFVVARLPGDLERSCLIYLGVTDLKIDEDRWEHDELVEEAHAIHGGMPYSHPEFVKAFRRIPRVKGVIDAWESGQPVELPFVSWSYGQTVVLRQPLDLLGACDDGGMELIIALETVFQGFNNHW